MILQSMKPLRFVSLLAAVLALTSIAEAQPGRDRTFTHADSLRGGWTKFRWCYDVTYYHLDVRIDPSTKTVLGSNEIRFRVLEPCTTLQIDLFKNMGLDSILLDGTARCTFQREENAVFITVPTTLNKGEHHKLVVYYGGAPIVAHRPPWDGGFIWTKDSTGGPWVAVTCEGKGASLWWPNKDHPADEPDSMLISVAIPSGLEDVSNGRLRSRTVLPNGWTRDDWFVSYPINNYCVTVNIGKFAHFYDRYVNGDTLTLDYFVLPQNLARAEKQFAQVKGMLDAFEFYFGPYPFQRDGYKLVESPHNGMEHQSCVAYGNGFANGYRGAASSPEGMTFDFIIIHESAHEWWGNSVTAADNADMWIHESFGAYAEALYVEKQLGREASLRYINAKRQNVRNEAPIQGKYGLNNEGSSDMYDKGQLVLNTLRSSLDNDTLWFSILRGIQRTYRYKTISYDTIVNYISMRSGKDFRPFFDQYFRHASLPRVDAYVVKQGDSVKIRFRWTADDSAFAMPLKLVIGNGRTFSLSPTSSWQSAALPNNTDPWSVDVDDNLYYCVTRIVRSYIIPEAPIPHRGMF